MTPNRKRLSDILANGNCTQLSQAWAETKPAEDFAPLPAGTYIAHVISGELFTAKTSTAGYKLAFKVAEGGHAGRQFWHDLWLTPAALPMTKRDLGKLGVVALEQLERPLPQGIRCKVKLALRKDDDGMEHNRVRTFEVLGIDAPEVETFAPDDSPAAPPGPATADTPAVSPEDGQGSEKDLPETLPPTPNDGIPI